MSFRSIALCRRYATKPTFLLVGKVRHSDPAFGAVRVRPAPGGGPQIARRLGPAWVKSGSDQGRWARPLCAQKQTGFVLAAWSGSGQERLIAIDILQPALLRQADHTSTDGMDRLGPEMICGAA